MTVKTTADKAKPILSVRDLTKHYPLKSGVVRHTVGYVKAVDGVSFGSASSTSFVDYTFPLATSLNGNVSTIVVEVSFANLVRMQHNFDVASSNGGPTLAENNAGRMCNPKSRHFAFGTWLSAPDSSTD